MDSADSKLQLVDFPSEEWKIAGNIAMHCKNSVLLMGVCDGILPLLLCVFGCDVYGIDSEESVSTGLENAYIFGLSPRFAVQDIFKPIRLTSGLFDTVVIGPVVSHMPDFLLIVKEACRLVRNNGLVIFVHNSKNIFKYLSSNNIPLNISFEIQQNKKNIVVALSHMNSECSVSGIGKEEIVNNFF